MTDRPIIFSAPMVRALLDGRKTQTRRIVKPQPAANARYTGIHFASDEPDCWFFNSPSGPCKVREAYAPGDRLWVRENWAKVPASAYRMSDGVVQTQSPTDAHMAAIYAAGWDRSIPKWKPSIHMPRWASRLTLVVTDVRVQRVQEISEEDAEAEGVFRHVAEHSLDKVYRDERGGTAIRYFSELWDNLNAKRGYGWDANPWVVAVTFTVHQQNIDAGGSPERTDERNPTE